MSGTTDVLAALGKPGPQAQVLATVICVLMTDGAILGELEERAIRSGGETRTVRVPPSVWFDRLAKAVARGALERMTPGAIAERILSTPEAA